MRPLFLVLCALLSWRAAGADLNLSFALAGTNGCPAGFHAGLLGGGGPVQWRVLPGAAPSGFASLMHPTATVTGGGSALAQTSEDLTDERFPLCIYDGQKFRNFRFSAQFKIVSGVAEQMAGLVFRFQNTSNFYVVRVSALGHNIRFYKVVNGDRSNPIGPACKITAGTWHDLTVQCDGNQITIFLDGQAAMPTLGDNTFTEGKIGFWTKSDSVTYFANATVNYTPVVPPAKLMVDNIMQQEPRIQGLDLYVAGTNDTTRIIASKDAANLGKPGTPAELAAIRNGTVSFARGRDSVYVTLPLHDRNGDYIAAVRFQLKSFFGETQDTAVNRATFLLKAMQQYGLSAADLAQGE